MIVLNSRCFCPLPIIEPLLFCKMTFPTPQSYCGVTLRDSSAAFAYALRLDSRYVPDDIIVMTYVYDSHLPNDTFRFTLECDDFWSHMCALNLALEATK